MDTLKAFEQGQAARDAGSKQRVFDWEKAARRILEAQPSEASAGLQSDWEWTGGRIWANGTPVPQEDTYTYLSSNWATPELELDGEREECWRYQEDTPGWGAKTYWPDEVLVILGDGKGV